MTSSIINHKLVFYSLLHLVLGILIGNSFISNRLFLRLSRSSFVVSNTDPLKTSLTISANVQIVDANEPIHERFQCVKTKKLLNYFSPTVCLHEKNKDAYVSGAFQEGVSIWEEQSVTRILKLLLRHPRLDFIDIGANIGTYTMYAAVLGRFVLAVECFAPNLNRIRRALQLTNVTNRVVLVQNALFSRSGELLRLSKNANNIGGQRLQMPKNQSINHSTIQDPYIVKTIQFNELLPIFVSRKVRGAIMKIDIEGSESFLIGNANEVFDAIDIPYIQMEWVNVRRFPDRVKIILDFFEKRKYEPRTLSCQVLSYSNHTTWPYDLCWLKRNVSNFC